MTSHLSTNNRGARPKPVIRRNQNPLSSELPYIREEKALNDSLIARLQQELDMRAARLRAARANVEMKSVECEHADLRLRATTSIRDKLVKTREMFSLSTNLPTSSDVEQIVSGLEDVSPNLLAVADSLNMGSDFIKDIERRIEEANLAVRMAQDAVGRSLEDEQEALLREEQCNSLLKTIERAINEMVNINQARNRRAIFRIQDEIWRQIFLEAAGDTDPLLDPLPSVTIAAVSYSWRTRALSYPALWKQIHIKASRFSRKDVDRVVHYRRRAGNRLPCITLEFVTPPSDISLALIAESLAGIDTVDSLLITGNPVGSIIRDSGRSVGYAVLSAIPKLRRLEISYLPNFQCKRHRLPDHIVDHLEVLVLRNTYLKPFELSVQAARPSRLAELTLLAQIPLGARGLRWDLFCAWIQNSATTLKNLHLEANFLPHQGPHDMSTVVFPRLCWIRTYPEQLLHLFRFSIHTPSLRSLVIPLSRAFDVEAWNIYATDARGGKGIINVVIADEIDAEDVASYSACLRYLPHLENLTLREKNVEPLLEALARRETASEAERPLANLHELTIANYGGDGDNILSFAIRYQQKYKPQDPPSGGNASTLRVHLRNCPNISSYVSRQLREFGSMD